MLLIKPTIPSTAPMTASGQSWNSGRVVLTTASLSGMANDRIEQKYLRPCWRRSKADISCCGRRTAFRRRCLKCSIKPTCFVFDEKEKGYELLVRAYLLQVVYDIIMLQKEEIQPVKANTKRVK